MVGAQARPPMLQTASRVLTSEELMDDELAKAAQSFSNLVG